MLSSVGTFCASWPPTILAAHARTSKRMAATGAIDELGRRLQLWKLNGAPHQLCLQPTLLDIVVNIRMLAHVVLPVHSLGHMHHMHPHAQRYM